MPLLKEQTEKWIGVAKLLTIYSGCMGSGKTNALIETATELKEQGKNIKVFYPKSCSNGETNLIKSRSGLQIEAQPATLEDILLYTTKSVDAIFIDEFQFFIEESNILIFKKALTSFEQNNTHVYFGGLDLDFRNIPFPAFEQLAPYASKITKFNATCALCGEDNATKTLRLRNGKPCKLNENILIEKNSTEVSYIASCSNCYSSQYEIPQEMSNKEFAELTT